MTQYKIAKRYTRKISKDYQSYEFMTEAEKTVEVNSAEELAAESDKLFQQVKALTEIDIQNNMDQIQPQGE